MPPTKILHIIDSLDLGGAQTVLLNLARYLPPLGFSIEVASMHGRGVFARPLEETGTPVHSLSPHKFFPAYLWNLPSLLAKQRFALAHFHLFGSNWIAKPLCSLCGVPALVSHDHCNDIARHEKKLALALDSLTNRCSSLVFGVSKSTCDFLLAHENLPQKIVHLLYNGVDTNDFSPPTQDRRAAAKRALGMDPSRFLVGGVGRLVEQKNFSLWLDAAAETQKTFPLTQFFIAGTGPQETSLKEKAASLKLRDLSFGGFVGDRPSLYHAFDALLISSDYEGLPMTLLEAMASGVPIAASSVDGLKEILTHGEDALLSPPGSASGFSANLSSLLSSPSLRENLSAAALQKIRSSFSASAQAESLASFYRELLAKNPPKR